uniref:Uncharacterized protein n=1 Tax=Cucumis melo TaxID=3656 RepID=A0A9I9EF24_CUCME
MCALAPIANNVVARDAVGYAGSSQTKADGELISLTYCNHTEFHATLMPTIQFQHEFSLVQVVELETAKHNTRLLCIGQLLSTM